MSEFIIALAFVSALFAFMYFIGFIVRLSWTDTFPFRNWKDVFLFQTSTYRDFTGEWKRRA